MTQMIESEMDPKVAVYNKVIEAGDHWMRRLKKGQVLRILDLEGNQAVDTLFYNADDPADRYSASDTIQGQGKLYLTTGSQLLSNRKTHLLTITADTGGACSRESNTMRYSLDKEHLHACRDSFLRGLQDWSPDLGKRDLPCNVNFFMNVPVTPEGRLTFEDGISSPGRYVEMRAEVNLLCLISNCPQINNPCNAYNPTPVQVFIW